MGKQWKQWEILLSWAPKSLQVVTATMKWKDAGSWKKSYDQTRQYIKKQRHYFANKGLSSQICGLPVVIYGCENWTIKKPEPKNWCFWTVVLEKTLESSLNSKEVQPVHPKWNQSWIFMEGLMLKVKLLYFGHLIRTDSFEKILMLGNIEGRRRRGSQRMR